ncbi:hypothetical protein [Variovorax ginsengisoli]|uniref:Uncharacterized protein n=1 Tax=Variovorax ginsengisoli TaxID=363844 RepID=A0ABT8SDL5_9BURK|nr:hypothetical protein [Variovorax ginsengisoli]MDN8617842.1 hypothetical protein [Variovorax ginsengisoli]MDO1537012.1 hypothetical protein [Variovorax ginsengisoli]
MNTISIIQPKRPSGPGWERETPPPAVLNLGYPIEVWWHAGNRLQAFSAVEVARDPGQLHLGPEYHLSVSSENERGKVRCSGADALWVLNEFGLLDAKEDNHVPNGIARNFWRPVADNLSGYECPCVDDEPAIREDKGDFVWRGITR